MPGSLDPSLALVSSPAASIGVGVLIVAAIVVLGILVDRRLRRRMARAEEHTKLWREAVDARVEAETALDRLREQAQALEERTAQAQALATQLEAANAALAARNVALRESEARYEALMQAGRQIVWTAAPDGRVTDIPEWRELTGLTLEEMRDHGWTRVVHPEDLSMLVEAGMRAWRERRSYEVEFRARVLDGTYRWFRARAVPVLDEQGAIREWVGTFTDVDARRRQEALRTLLARATSMIGDTLDADRTLDALARVCVPELADLAVTDVLEADGTIRRVTTTHRDPAIDARARESARRWPYNPETERGVAHVLRTGEPLFVPDVNETLVREYARDEEHLALLREIAPTSLLSVPLTARGRTLGALTLATGQGRRLGREDFDLANELARRAAVAVDNARLYEGERRARADAEQANRAKSEFLAVMSHELRTPLNAIAGYVELIEMGLRGPVSDQQREDLRRIRKNQRYLLSLVNDVLNLARIEAGAVSVALMPLPANDSLADLEPLVRPQLESKSLVYHATPCAPDVFALGDREKVRQILLNLLSNAIKFTPAHGRIEVWCDVDDLGVAFHVRDSGIGIPADRLAEIFEPFVQVDRGYTRASEGSGLGLAISRDLAQLMGGSLAVESEPGSGSTFTLRLRRAGAAVSKAS